MSSIEEHCKECLEKLGREYREIHEWLDEFAIKGEMFLGNHHKYRHHREGLIQVLDLFGPLAMSAAAVHIARDMKDMNGTFDILTQKQMEFMGGPDRWYKKSEVFGE